MMKYLLYVAAFMFCFTAFGQEKTDSKNDNPKDVIEETKVKTIKMKKDGETVEKKVKVTTKKEQEVKTVIEPDHYENSTRLNTPVKVTKTIKIDNDNDPFYDSETKMVMYTMNDQNYAFTKDNAGFVISYNKDSNEMIYGSARLTSLNGYYLLNTDNYSGIGYFNDEGNFVVEYYDEGLDAMIVQEFEESPF